MLVGRGGEVERIAGAVDAACAGRASVLRISGEPGIGKTALLDVAEALGTDHGMTVVRFTAVEPESGIPSAGLDLLLALLGTRGGLSGPPADLLAALGRACIVAPVMLLVDDLQWLDDVSMRALAFTCRRLLVDPVAVLLACRPEAESNPMFEPFPLLGLQELTTAQSIEVLAQVAPEMPTDVAMEVARELAGVPLALVGARSLLTPDMLAGRAPLPSPVPVGQAVQVRYAAGFGALEVTEQRALAVVAADDSGDPTVLVAALGRSGLGMPQLLHAERQGLVRLDGIPRFTHPLARAAVHAAAAPQWTREAHAVLGQVLHERGDARALRHRALGSPGPDEQVALDLESAARELARDAPDRASSLALLAADLSPRPEDRQGRMMMAAELCPDASRAVRLAHEVLSCAQDPNLRVRATFVIADNTPDADPAALIHMLQGVDRYQVNGPLAAELLCRLTWSAMESTDLRLLEWLVDTLKGWHDPDWVVLSALGSALMFLGRNEQAVCELRRAQVASAGVDPEGLSTDALTNWAVIPGWLGEDDSETRARFRRMDQLLRSRDRPMDLVHADFFGAERARREGSWDRSMALLTHGISLLNALGYPEGVDEARVAGLLAYRGQEEQSLDHLAHAQAAFAHRPAPWLELWVIQARGAIALTTGRLEEAVSILIPLRGVPFLGRGCRDAVVAGLVDLVEALVAAGDKTMATDVVDELARRTDGLVDPLGRALVGRCRALTGRADADILFDDALSQFERTSDVFELGRTQLHLGEHLRRSRRRRLSRTHLMAAEETFTQLGAGPWADRARRELIASGERASSRATGPTTADADLTPQELRVALEVARGLSNAQVGGSLFLSAKTVEFHLGKVYRKLGVRSRGGLAQALGSRGLLDPGA